MSEELKLHPKQGEIFFSDAKVTLAAAGRQGGKTVVGSLWLARQISERPNRNYLIGAPTFRILHQSTLPTFLRLCGNIGVYKKGDQEIHCRNGKTIFLRTSTDPDSMEGISDVGAILLDEAGKCKYRFYVNAEGRAARTNAPIMIVTSPYSMNWVFKEVIKPFKEKTRTDIFYRTWPSIENPTFPVSEYERQRSILDHVTFSMFFGGEHHRRVGLVHPLEDGQIITPFTIPEGSKIYAGLDWGFRNPMALIIRALLPDGRDIQFSEFYESGVLPDDVVRLIKQKVELYNIDMIVADPEDPGKIAMCQRAGIPITPGDNKDNRALDAHNRILKSGKYYIFNSCKHTLDEYETYHWKEKDEDDDKDFKEEAVKLKDHTMNANQYLSLYLAQTHFYLDKPRVKAADSSVTKFASNVYDPRWKFKEKKEKKLEEL